MLSSYKKFFILGLLVFSFPAFSKVYKSNSIGQILDDDKKETPYTLEVQDNQKTLFKDGEKIKLSKIMTKQEFFPENGKLPEFLKNYSKGEISSTLISKNMNLIKNKCLKVKVEFDLPANSLEMVFYDELDRVIMHSYNDYDEEYIYSQPGQLISTVKKDKLGQEIGRVIFYRDLSNGSLFGYKIIDENGKTKTAFFDERKNKHEKNAVITDEGEKLFETFFSSVILNSDDKYEWDENGNLIIKSKDSKTLVYDDFGHLIKSDNEEYIYDEKFNISKIIRQKENGGKQIIYYKESGIEKTEEYVLDNIIKEYRMLDDEDREEIFYEDGKKYVKVVTDKYGKTKSVEYY